MRTLIVFYSRTGTTKKAAEALAEKIGADVEELVDQKDRSGMSGWLKSGRDAMRKSLTSLNETKKNPADYDLIIIGSPVWAGTMSAAVRTYLSDNQAKLKEAAFFSTQGGANEQRIFGDMENLIGKKPKAILWMTTKEVRAGEIEKKMEEFVAKVK